MLKVKVTPHDFQAFTSVLHDLNFTYFAQTFTFRDDKLGEIVGVMDEEETTCLFTFFAEEDFTYYQRIHDLLTNIAGQTAVSIDDSEAFMGYLEDGRASYLMTNWQEWVDFLLKAKHRTLTGQKVKLFSTTYAELAEGILVDYEAQEHPFCVTSCTLITTSGEQTWNEEQYIVEATGEMI